MANLFVKNGELKLVNGANSSGYLVLNDEKQTPVFHGEFVALQKEASYLIALANKVKGADLKGKKAVTIAELEAEVKKEMSTKARTFVATPTAVERPMTDSLAKEALAWLNFQEEGSKVEKINKMMQRFNTIAEFEEFGLYFTTDQIVKLDALHTLEEIVAAMTILQPHYKA